jgi:hypothetical protein
MGAEMLRRFTGFLRIIRNYILRQRGKLPAVVGVAAFIYCGKKARPMLRYFRPSPAFHRGGKDKNITRAIAFVLSVIMGDGCDKA